MSPRHIGVDPTQLVWSNLRINWWELVVRGFAVTSFIIALIIFWAIPVAVVGFISNISYITQKIPWLAWINNCPSVIMGVITSLLPSIMLAVLMALLPIILRTAAKWSGCPSLAAIELRTQNYYFSFLVVHGFLVTTLCSAATSAVQQIINDPSSVTTLLSQKLPASANFYYGYIALQGLSFAPGALLQLSALVIGIILGKVLDNTPRKKFMRWAALADLGWGTVYPTISLLGVIGKFILQW